MDSVKRFAIQQSEFAIGCKILDQMRMMAKSDSYPIAS